MKTFLINLDRNPERLERMSALLARMELPYQRIAAIDGATLTDAALTGASPALSRGEVGCLLSHRAAWQIIAGGPDPYGAVLEDDIHMAPDLPGFLSGWDWIPDGADVVTLEAGRRSVAIAATGTIEHARRKVSPLASTHSGAATYIISAALARRLSAAPVANRPADAVLFDPPVRGSRPFGVYQVHPALTVQDSFLPAARRDKALASNLESERRRTRRETTTFTARAVKGIARPLQNVSQKVVSLFAPAGRSQEWLTVPFVPEV
jgi:glycosyl transferase family 25